MRVMLLKGSCGHLFGRMISEGERGETRARLSGISAMLHRRFALTEVSSVNADATEG
ncbi:MAG TPA: hypothetical protein VGB73_20980 [Pyrinomonadaceae bacterium]